MKSTPVNEGCLVPDCEHERHCRGLCRNHYTYVAGLVGRGKTSWDELQAHGKVLESRGRGGKGLVGTWLMDFTKGK